MQFNKLPFHISILFTMAFLANAAPFNKVFASPSHSVYDQAIKEVMNARPHYNQYVDSSQQVMEKNNPFGEDKKLADAKSQQNVSRKSPQTGKANSPQIFGYYTNWATYGRNFQPEQIQMKDATAIIYAFAQVGNCASPFATDSNPLLCNSGAYATGVQDFKLYSIDPYSDFNVIPQGYSHAGETWNKGNMTKVINLAHAQNKLAILSIGGYTLSVPLTTAMDTKHRPAFIQSIAAFLKTIENDNKNAQQGKNKTFDGIDVDWEPNWDLTTPQQIKNYANFLQELRIVLQKINQKSLLTIATWANPDVVKKVGSDNWKMIADNVDYINIMTYDYHGAFDNPQISNLLAPLHFDENQPSGVVGRETFNIESTMKTYLAQGIETSKLVLGLPSYGRAVQGVANIAPDHLPSAKGLYQRFSSAPSGQWDDTGIFDYKYIIGKMLGNGYTDYQVAGTAAAYNPSNGYFISYDNVTSLLEKIAFVKKLNLGGVMFWELSGDLETSDPNYNTSALVHIAKTNLQ